MTDEEQFAEAAAMPQPPAAKRIPHERTFHGDTFTDPYEWMRDKDSPDVREYVAAQNQYCDARMAGLAGLRSTLFGELKSRIQQTDMSVPTRMNGYWYFARTVEGQQYGLQCRMPVRGEDDWEPPQVDASSEPGSLPGEQIIFDANRESQGHDFFRLGGLELSRDGRWMLYGVDTSGDERYDFRIRDLDTGEELPDLLEGIGGASLTPDGKWVFYVLVDDAWRPYAVRRHQVGTPVEQDAEVYREDDERFWVGVGMSFDERNIVIGTGSKTSTEVWMLPMDTPEGEFSVFIPRQADIEYDVSFACFEGAGEHGEDIPLAIVYHNASNPNFEIDVIDMRSHKPPYRLGEGVRVAVGSPYGCERGDGFEPGASVRRIGEAYFNPANPAVLQGTHGLAIEGIAMYRHFVSLAYRTDGLPRVAIMTKERAAADFLAGRPWAFRELTPPALEGDWDADLDADDLETAASMSGDDAAGPHPHRDASAGTGDESGDDAADLTGSREPQMVDTWDGAADDLLPGETRRLYSIGSSGNPSYDAPRMRYSFSSYTRPGELHDIDPASGEDRLLKRATVLGDFDPRDYMERRVWITARDGEQIPVSLAWRRDIPVSQSAMFIIGYGAYEISSDPGFSVSRLSLLDRGVLYAVPHIRGGGEMGRAWYEQGRRLNKKHSFEDFVDATVALQEAGLADRRRTVANGGSAGGLLMGAVANLAPDRYAGIEADVPFVDALTSILDPSLPLTVTEWDEWGDPLHDADVYRYMKSYTPYENAPDSGGAVSWRRDADGKPVFPKLFVTTSMNDTRVLVVEPLKWVARLQAAGVDAIVKIEVEAGHGGTTGRYKQWEEVSYENAWCLSVMSILH
ncbi:MULTISPECIES: S9 family peptidase [Bifidobacterium]|uniref:S9 family peptidase n=1 Tax=Bifidobacterium TaxID=1678 RepID=UPI001BDBCF9E|nr:MULTISPECIES: S9 family peptidase [Bifidobacterium]MBT1161557.1 S9 family peptidase [Bifidobacterium sp. SO1]MBW3078933.1 S9 family peptidase [Bifidobacterium simiiventris]